MERTSIKKRKNWICNGLSKEYGARALLKRANAWLKCLLRKAYARLRWFLFKAKWNTYMGAYRFKKKTLPSLKAGLWRARAEISFRVLRWLLFMGAAWQLDLLAAGVIAHYYDEVVKWIFYFPFNVVPHFPYLVIGWEAAAWTVPDAYVKFFALLWFAFALTDIKDLIMISKKSYAARERDEL